MTKKELQLNYNYNNAKHTSITQLYKNASEYKHRAERIIKNKMQTDKGFGYRVIGGSCHTFSCGYLFIKDKQTFLKYFTAYNTYIIPYEQS